MPPAQPPSVLESLARRHGVLMVMDVVESVRLMEEDEGGFVRRWRRLVEQTEQQVLPVHGGRIVKSLGDGLMLEFGDARQCVGAAFGIQQAAQDLNRPLEAAHHLCLRMGAHVTDYLCDRFDIYGSGVNLTARIAGLAGIDQLLVSAGLRDQLTAGLHADVEDLGECWLKHVRNTIRLFRVSAPGSATSAPAASS
ncbi:adenylate/guanylate cyclase domain-containing protein [Ramlibacter tataouinensis]|uniref:Adenylate cyclase-like protein n=1 Tax=Ramlibacter tataouinensis (strain ATCC BAA-407 / DSM 14655 / LMG 21543 / TTB310) TaxID=365046 RepID=F5XW55_RAMTT|nr:adenylate/guanylate cyclase domain-containing protein [Ramlibacter tataouinensis]AEG91625.1 adenylate cyclase-like protein [Ramlibacter tataouinensis TTB310]